MHGDIYGVIPTSASAASVVVRYIEVITNKAVHTVQTSDSAPTGA